MKALTPWRPTRTVSMQRDEIADLFSTSSATRRASSASASKVASLQPVDIVVKDGAIVVKAGLPGIGPKSVGITMHGDRPTIMGEGKAEREEHETAAGVRRGSLRALRLHRAAAGPH
jgi:HSP20 family molecular chaperone IbpA